MRLAKLLLLIAVLMAGLESRGLANGHHKVIQHPVPAMNASTTTKFPGKPPKIVGKPSQPSINPGGPVSINPQPLPPKIGVNFGR